MQTTDYIQGIDFLVKVMENWSCCEDGDMKEHLYLSPEDVLTLNGYLKCVMTRRNWLNMSSVGMEGLKVRPMLIKESDDPCVYDTATGEFVFVNKGDDSWK